MSKDSYYEQKFQDTVQTLWILRQPSNPWLSFVCYCLLEMSVIFPPPNSNWFEIVMICCLSCILLFFPGFL